ncbi:hypothetical protein JCM6882_007329 [Rhodosporidiobolus microsporus]
MATLDLKLALDNETRLLSLPAATAPTWNDFVSQVQERFALESPPTAVTYIDDDGDEITLSSDAELAELFASSAGDTSLSLALVVNNAINTSSAEHAGPPPRSPETLALLKSVRQALEKDFTLAHDLRKVVHDVLGPPPRFRHFHHPRHGFAPRGGRGGRGRGRGSLHHGAGRLEMKDRCRREDKEDPASSSSSHSDSDDDDASETEKQPSPPVDGKHRRGKSGRKGFKHHHRAVPARFGPPPFHPAHHGAFPPPPPPGSFSPFDFFGQGPPAPPPFGHGHGHGHGKKGRMHGFHHHPPPPPPPPHVAFEFQGPSPFPHSFGEGRPGFFGHEHPQFEGHEHARRRHHRF